jgi:hypothetical protein
MQNTLPPELKTAIAAIGEAVTGLALVVSPPIVVRLLFGAELDSVGVVMSRVAGIALVALGIACWPGNMILGRSRTHWGMLTYSTLIALDLAYVGFTSELTGNLLWPAVVVHTVLTVLLILT